jgi:hypothetical protein
MNKVRHSIMDAVVMALMAERQAVTNVVSQFWIVLNCFDMVCFKLFFRSAMLASIVISFEYLRFPCQIFRASSTVILLFVFALGYALAFSTTVDMIAPYTFARALNKHLTAYFTSIFAFILSACLGAIYYIPSHKRGRPLKNFTTLYAGTSNLLRLRGGAAFLRTKPLFSIFVPITVRFFCDDSAACFTLFQPFRMGRTLFFRYAYLATRARAIFSLFIVFHSFTRIISNRNIANYTQTQLHTSTSHNVSLFDLIIAKDMIKCQA